MTLKPMRVGLTFGILTAFYVFVMGLLATFFNYGEAFIGFLKMFYLGYDSSVTGAIIGTVWGFLDGFIFGFLIIWLYNKLEKFS